MKKKISLLKPHPHNKILYNDTNPEQVEDLAENIKTYGLGQDLKVGPFSM